MILKVLGCGTSSGVPIAGCKCRICTSSNPKNKRSRTSAVIQADPKTNILIDTTIDLRYQALKWNIDSINAVLFTHAHADHILGLDDLRSFNFVAQRPIPCFATAETFCEIERIFWYIFRPDPGYTGGPITKITTNEIRHGAPFYVAGLKIEPFGLLHGNCSVTGYRCGDLAYATDCKTIPDESYEILKGVRYLLLDGLRYDQHRAHMTIPESIDTAQRIGAEETYLVHMTHSVDFDEVSAKLPPGVMLAYDGMEIEFAARAQDPVR